MPVISYFISQFAFWIFEAARFENDVGIYTCILYLTYYRISILVFDELLDRTANIVRTIPGCYLKNRHVTVNPCHSNKLSAFLHLFSGYILVSCSRLKEIIGLSEIYNPQPHLQKWQHPLIHIRKKVFIQTIGQHQPSIDAEKR